MRRKPPLAPMLLFIALVLLNATLAAENKQEIVPLGDAVYGMLDDLYLEAGLARYSGARPCSVAELSLALARLPSGRLSKTGLVTLALAQERFARIPRYAEGERFAFSGSLAAGLESYFHIPLDASGRAGSSYIWSYGYEERMPVLTATADLFLSGFMWIGASFDLKEEYRAIDDRMSPAGLYAGRSETNFLSIPGKLTDLDTFFPFRGAMAIGSDAVSLEFGRDDVDWGNGRTGNLIVSDYSDYYDFVRLAVFSDAFKFSSLFSSFHANLSAGERFLGLTAHRLEYTPADFLRLSLTESLALGGAGYYPDYIHDLNPVAIYHAWLAAERANSLMTLEIDLAPVKFINVYAQVGVDEFQTGAETEAGALDKATAMGFIAGLRSSLPFDGGYFRAGYEFVSTDPWLYNRFAAPYYRSQRRIWSFIVPAFDEWVIKPTGYEAGPDALVHDIEIGYEKPGLFRAALGFGWTAKGEIDLLTPYPPKGSPLFAAKTPSGIVEGTGELRLSGNWTMFPFLEISGGIRYIDVTNVGHVQGRKTDDIELVFGIRATLR